MRWLIRGRFCRILEEMIMFLGICCWSGGIWGRGMGWGMDWVGGAVGRSGGDWTELEVGLVVALK